MGIGLIQESGVGIQESGSESGVRSKESGVGVGVGVRSQASDQESGVNPSFIRNCRLISEGWPVFAATTGKTITLSGGVEFLDQLQHSLGDFANLAGVRNKD